MGSEPFKPGLVAAITKSLMTPPWAITLVYSVTLFVQSPSRSPVAEKGSFGSAAGG